MNQVCSNLMSVAKNNRIMHSNRCLANSTKTFAESCLYLCFTADHRFWHLNNGMVIWRLDVFHHPHNSPTKGRCKWILFSCLRTINLCRLDYSKTILRTEMRKCLVFNTEFKKKRLPLNRNEQDLILSFSDLFIDHFFAFLNNIHVKIWEGFRGDHLKV